MKCIYCSSDTKYSDRQSNGGKCQSCKHPFAFEPKPDPLTITDPLFQRLIKDVSGDNTVFFTERQLWYELNRRISRKSLWRAPWGWVAGGSLAGGVATATLLSVLWPVAVGMCGLGIGAALNARARKNAPAYGKLSQGDFISKYLQKWVGAHGPIAKLLPPPPRGGGAREQTVPPDVTAYSFDRALVTEDAETAAMLVANNFHFENNCAILSADGFPFGITDTIMTMLRRNAQLTVFAVHDASVSGCLLPQTLRGERWFPDTVVRVLDLGLRPRHAQALRLLLARGERTTGPPALRAALTAEEVAWLESGNRAELAVLRPAKLMRSLYQGFARANQTGAGMDDGGGIWLYDSGTGVYASDSFG